MTPFDRAWSLLKDFYFGTNPAYAGSYVAPTYNLPADYELGDEISDDEITPNKLKDKPYSSSDFTPDFYDFDNDELEWRKDPSKGYLSGSSRPRPLPHKPSKFLQIKKPRPLEGGLSGDNDIPLGEEWFGTNLAHESMTTDEGEPNIPRITDNLLHEAAHYATFEEIMHNFRNNPELKDKYVQWAHEFVANNLMRPGGYNTRDWDERSDEAVEARGDSLPYYPFEVNLVWDDEGDGE